MTKTIIEKVVADTGKDHEDVSEVVDSFLENLHKKMFEHNSKSSYFDYVHSQYFTEVSNKSFFHFLGILHTYADTQADNCTSELTKASIAHTLELSASREHWLPYIEKMQQWKKPTKD
ncbi:hypothetical protein D5R81_04835 [Parashewanella spongiae]|uniref:Uncharacterized protein n=1 Tax=Parashewanella spongiae TaxID=342950 RepID=A0A3A6TW16_9GAMM|nr:hypothetical protein [Parashewanella spongiae]MCL1077278.1 hypothetical protein [Parashewanella spongiae]RJY18542.1 hypothetical protein D5R81_04835 [Parashewanella spongiae]